MMGLKSLLQRMLPKRRRSGRVRPPAPCLDHEQLEPRHALSSPGAQQAAMALRMTSGRSLGWVVDLRPKYNQVQQLSSHNSYDDNGPKADVQTQLAMGVRSFELDLHVDAASGNWAVYHITHIFSGGNYIDNLASGLDLFRRYHDQNPNHEVITIWLQLPKDGWTLDGHLPANLDSLIDSKMNGLVYRPGTLKHSVPNAANLRSAVQQVGWPALDDLRGKFMFVIMGNDDAGNRYLYDVLGYDGGFTDGHEGYRGNRNLFVAPENDILGKLRVGPKDNWQNAVFFNCHNTDGAAAPTAVYKAGFVSRIWRVDDQSEYNAALASYAQHIATDHVTQGLFTPRLVNMSGKPFRMIGR